MGEPTRGLLRLTEASCSVASVRLKLRLKLKLKLKRKLMLKLKLMLRPGLWLWLRLRLRLRLTDTEATLADTTEDTLASLRLRLQLSLSTDTKNYRYEEPLFEYIPFFPEPHLQRTLQVTHTKSLEPIRMCAFTMLIRKHIYLKHIDSVFSTQICKNQVCSSYQILL